MTQSYWSETLERRISRRRAIAATSATAAAAAFLAACGGGSSDSPSTGESSGLITQPVDTTNQAKRGGTMKYRLSSEPPTLDIFTANLPHNNMNHAYASFLRIKPGHLKPAENEIQGYMIESWERSPDGLTLTMKMRPGVIWHNKPPLNGRQMDIQDIVFSWDRFAAKSGSRDGVANSANPQAPVLSVTAADSRTVVVKLKEPIIHVLGFFTTSSSGNIVVIPKETDAAYDIRTDMIGTGGFVMTNYTPSVGFTFKRHPDFYDKDYALIDQIDAPIIAEYSTALAQLKAGNIYSFGPVAISSDDIIPVKREEPRLNVYEADLAAPAGTSAARVMSFGWLPAGKSPFLDERVRQAMSMSWDRDLFLDTFSNRAQFEAEGLPMQNRWSSSLDAAEDGWWLDPKGKGLGDDAKYFQYNPAEAKKLLAAAGYPGGFDTTSHYVTGTELPTAKLAEVLDQFASEVGIRSQVHPVDYLKEYIPGYRDGKGQYDGWAYKSDNGGPPHGNEAIGKLAIHFWSSSPLWHGQPDPAIDALIEKGRVEADTEKRKAIVGDIQRDLAKKMYALRPPGLTSGFTLAWPCIANFRVYQGAHKNERVWIDDTKPPFKPA